MRFEKSLSILMKVDVLCVRKDMEYRFVKQEMIVMNHVDAWPFRVLPKCNYTHAYTHTYRINLCKF